MNKQVKATARMSNPSEVTRHISNNKESIISTRKSASVLFEEILSEYIKLLV
jgi:hypothetical protein